MSNCLWGHGPTSELGATNWQWQQPCAVRVVTTSVFEVLPFSYLLLHAACDTWVCVLQLSPFKSAGIWSNAGHPREKDKSWIKCSSSIKPLGCQCWVQLSPLSLVIGKNRGSCQGLLVSTGLNQRGVSVMVSTGLYGGQADFLGSGFRKLLLPFTLVPSVWNCTADYVRASQQDNAQAAKPAKGA